MLRSAAARNSEKVCDRREYQSCDKAVDEAFDKTNQHSQRRPSKAWVKLQPGLMQAAIGNNYRKRKASEISDDQKCPQA